MSQHSRVPEYSVEESVKIPHMENKPVSSDRKYMAVQADLALLYQELNISVDILGKIRDTVLVLQQSVQEP